MVTNNETQFDLTRVNTQHTIWIDGTSTSTIVTESLAGLSGEELDKKRNEIAEMQRLAHLLLKKLSKENN